MPYSDKLNGLSTYQAEVVYAAFGKRVKFLREMIGMTQVEMAKKLDMTRTSLTNIEAGRQRVQLHGVAKIAKVLRVQPDRLLRGIWNRERRTGSYD